MKSLIPIGDVFAKGIFGKRGETLMAVYYLRKHWPSIVGESLAKKTHPKTIRSDTLTVSTESPAWAQNLSMMKNEVLAAIHEKTGQRFSDLRFVTESRS
jgi:predicted nucleic acid-binding Zn ribbon protein